MLVGNRFLFVPRFVHCSLFLCDSATALVCHFCLDLVWVVRCAVGCWYCCVYVDSLVVRFFVRWLVLVLRRFVGCLVSRSVVYLHCLVLLRLCFVVVFLVLSGRGVAGVASLGG